mmetsp:Transcript_4977/g.12782  ORF Transcript_4977/g.12782 Transcript_4977/m.12782 type:complete len:215 (-) Transcript_4977:6021-6665(-)
MGLIVHFFVDTDAYRRNGGLLVPRPTPMIVHWQVIEARFVFQIFGHLGAKKREPALHDIRRWKFVCLILDPCSDIVRRRGIRYRSWNGTRLRKKARLDVLPDGFPREHGARLASGFRLEVSEHRKQAARASMGNERNIVDPRAPPNRETVHGFSHRPRMQNLFQPVRWETAARNRKNAAHQSNPAQDCARRSDGFDGLFRERDARIRKWALQFS